MERLPEDRFRDMPGVNTRFRTVPEQRMAKRPGPRLSVTPDRGIPRREVEERLMRSMRTLRVIPDTERRYFMIRSNMPEYVREYLDAYDSASAFAPKFSPTPFDVSDYLTALSWARHLDKSDWKILWWRSCELSFGQIAKYIGRSDETVRRRYRDILTDVWCSANNVSARSAA